MCLEIDLKNEIFFYINPKKAVNLDLQCLDLPCPLGFSPKKFFYKESEALIFVTFNIVVGHIFSVDFTGIFQIVQRI